MKIPRLLPALVLPAILAAPAGAVVFRSYDAARHARFDPFPTDPGINPSQIFASLDLTGIGWYPAAPQIQFALVSRQHVVFATHFQPSVSGSIRFLGATGTIVTRTQALATIIEDDGQDSDLIVVKLSAPIDAATGVEPLAILDLPEAADYVGLPLGVAGIRDEGGGVRFPVIGKGTIAEVETSSRNDIDYDPSESSERFLNNRFMRFDYALAGTDGDEVHFQVGDSGSPSFVPTGGRAALVGVHSYVEEPPPGNKYRNFDVFVPHSVGQLDAVLEPDGYRIRPVNAPPTTLGDSSSTIQPTPRRAMPLDFAYTLANTGGNPTGNLEVEFHFAAGEAPDTLTPPAGWVTYGTGPSWTFRRALLAAGADASFTATWSATPAVAGIDPGIIRRSDTTATHSPAIVIPLAPSFAEWADHLTAKGTTDDPDADGLSNLLEYALGSDPASGAAGFFGGDLLRPVISASGSTITLTFPERADKELRGLSYLAEFSADLGGWTPTPPAGLDSHSEAYSPEVPGFVKRVLTWQAGSTRGFARLRIGLNE